MTQFVSSPEILTLQTEGSYRLTRHSRHEDFAVWDRGRIIAQGGRSLVERVFHSRLFRAQPSPQGG
jgi:hypothetical protein